MEKTDIMQNDVPIALFLFHRKETIRNAFYFVEENSTLFHLNKMKIKESVNFLVLLILYLLSPGTGLEISQGLEKRV